MTAFDPQDLVMKATGGAYCWAEGDELAGAREVLCELHRVNIDFLVA